MPVNFFGSLLTLSSTLRGIRVSIIVLTNGAAVTVGAADGTEAHCNFKFYQLVTNHRHVPSCWQIKHREWLKAAGDENVDVCRVAQTTDKVIVILARLADDTCQEYFYPIPVEKGHFVPGPEGF